MYVQLNEDLIIHPLNYSNFTLVRTLVMFTDTVVSKRIYDSIHEMTRERELASVISIWLISSVN